MKDAKGRAGKAGGDLSARVTGLNSKCKRNESGEVESNGE